MKAKYRILGVNVLPNDFSMPKGETTATLTQKLTDRLDHVKSFWEEASLECIEVDPVVHPTVVKLPKAMNDYHLKKRPKLIDGSGVTWGSVTFAGETLNLKGPSNFKVTVTFPTKSLSLVDTAKEINKAILAAWTGTDKTVPIVAPERGSDLGQIRIQTREYVAAGTTLEIDGGTAVALLGLDASNRITLDGSNTTGGDLRTALVDAVKAATSGQSTTAARAYVNGFHSVVVNFVTDIGWWILTAQANEGQVEYDIFGKPNTKLAGVWIAKVYAEDVFAHEFGHNLGFPNLYSEYGRTEGVELASWDIMANNGTSHPSAWIKGYESSPADAAKRWIKAEHVKTLKRPKAGSSESVEVLLLPQETEYPASNPYATNHPGVPLCHAVRVPLDGSHSYFIENRQKGPWNDPKLGKIDHNLTVPGSGIVVTETINTVQPDRAQATLVQSYELDLSEGALGITRLPDETDAEWAERVQKARDAAIFNFYPLDAVGDEMTLYEFPNGLDKIRLEVTDVVGTQTPRVLKVKADWGRKGKSFDLAIKDWESPPPWESVDIWVDNDLDNGWDEYKNSDATKNPTVTGHPILNGDRSKVGVENVLYARVRNDGDIAQSNVRVDFEITKPPAMGPAAGFRLGTDWVDIPAGGTALAKVRWTPRTANEAHVCVRAIAEYRGTDIAAGVVGELNQNNNVGRENITEWFLTGSSPYKPVSFNYVVVNPLPEEAEFYMHARGLPAGMDLHVQPHHFRLGPGEQVTGHATLSAAPTVPFSDDFDEELPVVSLEAMVSTGCSWRSIGGVSGVVHTVREAAVDGSLDPAGGGTVSVSAKAETGHGPIAGVNVRMSLVQGGERELAVERRDTNAQGYTYAELTPRQAVAPGTPLEVNISLSPTRGTGPAEATLAFVAA